MHLSLSASKHRNIMSFTRYSLFLILAFPIQLLAQAGPDKPLSAPVDTLRLYRDYKQKLAVFEKEHGHFITTPNVRMHYLTWGKRSGTPIVWAHGTFGNAFELYTVADSLVLAGYYIIAIDYYGHGLTPIPQKEVSVWHVADDIRFILDELKIKKAVIGGFSRGGTIATAFYDAYPERTKAVILEDGGSVVWDINEHKKPLDTSVNQTLRDYAARQPAPVYESEEAAFALLYSRTGTSPYFERIAFTFFNRLKQDSVTGKWSMNPGVDNLIYERTAEQQIMASHQPFAVTGNSIFGSTSHLLYPKIIYRNLDVPMIIFDPVSAQDYFDFEEENNRLTQQHPDLITHKVYTNTAHTVKIQRPTEFIRDMTAFLEKIKKRKG
jgi:pimeloyl-ACP methyl ester carboxylesterase